MISEIAFTESVNASKEGGGSLKSANQRTQFPNSFLPLLSGRHGLFVGLRVPDGSDSFEEPAVVAVVGLDDGPGVQPFKILLRQVANAMMLVRIHTVTRGGRMLTFSGAHHGYGCFSGYPIVD